MEDRGLPTPRAQLRAPRSPPIPGCHSRAAPRTSSPAGARGASARRVAPSPTGGVPAGKAQLGRTGLGRVAARALPAPGRGLGGWTTPRGLADPAKPQAPSTPPATHLAARGSHMAGGLRRLLDKRAGDTEASRSGTGARRGAASRGSCGTGRGRAAQAESAFPRGCGGPRAIRCRLAAGGEGVAFAPRSVSRPAPGRGRGPRRGGPVSGVVSFEPEVRARGVGPRRELRLLGGQRRPAVMEAMAPHAHHGGARPSGLPRRPLRRRRRTHRASDAPAPSPEVGSGPGSRAPSCATLVASLMSNSPSGEAGAVQAPGRRTARSLRSERSGTGMCAQPPPGGPGD